MFLVVQRSLPMPTVWLVSSEPSLCYFVPLATAIDQDPSWQKIRAAQCPAEACNGERAYFFQLQIRSADEPMTTFLKVCPPYVTWGTRFSDSSSVLLAVLGGERIRVGHLLCASCMPFFFFEFYSFIARSKWRISRGQKYQVQISDSDTQIDRRHGPTHRCFCDQREISCGIFYLQRYFSVIFIVAYHS